MRIFISTSFPEEVKREIKKIQHQLPKFSGKLTELKNMHLTLKFLGDISEEQLNQVKSKLKKIKFNKLNVKFSSLGVFSSNFIRIIWISLSGIESLQKEIDNSLSKLFPKEKRFMSHITIARVKSLENKQEFLDKIKKIKFPEVKFNIEKFEIQNSTLTSSSPEYQILEEYYSG